jgi:thiamine-phosphate pyrophosphorylase
MILPRVLVLTDRTLLPAGSTLIEQVEKCLDGGATHVVLREFDLPPSVRSETAEALTVLGATVIAARDLVVGAAGLHQPSTARGPVRRVVGRSCHSRAEVLRAAGDGCTYATLGPFAPTASKPGYGPPITPGEYVELPIPTYSLGGVTVHNAGVARAAGAYGVAVMGAVMRSANPERVVADLLEAVS